MFTSDEIRQITFEKGVRGYRTEDVESFLESIAEDFRTLERDKKDLEDKLYLLAERVEQYKREEESIKTTLINAQRLGESIVEDARTKADNIIREATIKKNDILSAAYSEIEGSEDTLKRLKKEVSDFKRTVLSLYKTHIESLSDLPEEKTEEEPSEEPVEIERTREFEPAIEAEPEVTTEFVPEVREDNDDRFKSVSSLFDE